jgi:hypothetical protein
MAQRTAMLDEPGETMAMLHTDHQRVRELFQRYAHSRDPHLRHQMAAQVLVALQLYALVEETMFAPTVGEETNQEGAARVEDAREDPQKIRQLMAQLRACDPEDVGSAPRFQDLMDCLSHYV